MRTSPSCTRCRASRSRQPAVVCAINPKIAGYTFLHMTHTRRSFLQAAAASAAGLLVLPSLLEATTAGTPITVYKTPTCGCCKAWVEHLQKNGFAPTTHDLN